MDGKVRRKTKSSDATHTLSRVYLIILCPFNYNGVLEDEGTKGFHKGG